MDDKNGFLITDRDRVLMAWENSTELVRDYQGYAKDIKNKELAKLFSEYAETEAKHASQFLKLLRQCDGE